MPVKKSHRENEYDIMSVDIMSVKEASEQWNISEHRIQELCEEGRIEGVRGVGRSYMIHKIAQKPVG